jgi:hypothetical protein
VDQITLVDRTGRVHHPLRVRAFVTSAAPIATFDQRLHRTSGRVERAIDRP